MEKRNLSPKLEEGEVDVTNSEMEGEGRISSIVEENSSINAETANNEEIIADNTQQNYSHELDDQIYQMIKKLEEMGPTISRYQYNEASNEVQQLASEMKEKALSSMIHHLHMAEAQKRKESSPPKRFQSNSKASASYSEVEKRLKELEKQSNKVARRIKEHKRDQAQTMEKIQYLEARAFLEEHKDFVKDMLSRDPTETDLRNLKTIRLMLKEKKCAESRIQLLNMRAAALDRAMGNVAKSSWFIKAGQPPIPSSANVNAAYDNTDLRDLTSVMSSSREINPGRPLPDFTQMSTAKREAFLNKNFSERLSLESSTSGGSQRGIFANLKKPKPQNAADLQHRTSDDVGNKSVENSGMTIVTLNSDEAANSDREPNTKNPADPSDQGTEKRSDENQ